LRRRALSMDAKTGMTVQKIIKGVEALIV
jgi:hypothetical protein